MISDNRNKYQSLVDFAGHYIYPDNFEDPEYNEICSKQIDITIKRFAIKFLTIAFGGCAAVSGPVYVYITDGIKTSITDLRIPFTEEGSNAEFVVNLIYQFNIFSHGILLYTGLEVMISIFENVIILSPQLIKHELKKLNAKQNSKEFTDQQVHDCFKNIVKRTIDVQR